MSVYVFKECEVIVLPGREDPNDFPGGPDAWGLARAPEDTLGNYERKGWCVSECATARVAGTIVNGDDPAVRRLGELRSWPTSLAEYQAMMEAKEDDGTNSVEFTSKGDREVVTQLFFRLAYDVAGGDIAGGAARLAPRATAPRVLSLSALLSRFSPRRRPSVREVRGDKTALVTEEMVSAQV